jgi:hypothetical protein
MTARADLLFSRSAEPASGFLASAYDECATDRAREFESAIDLPNRYHADLRGRNEAMATSGPTLV